MCCIALCLCFGIFLLLRIRPPSVLKDDGTFPKEAILQGTVCDKYLKNGSFYLVLSKTRFAGEEKSSEKPLKKTCNVLIKLKALPDAKSNGIDGFLSEPKIGQKCLVSGRIYFFEESRNPGQFDMALYEKYKGIDFELTSAVIRSFRGRENLLKEYLVRLKYRLSCVYDSLLDEDDAGIVKAMVLGDKNSLDTEIKGLYQRAGISHVLCISGLHISLLGCGLYLFLQGRLCPGRPREKLYLTRLPAGIISLVCLILYGYMTGMGVSIKRALIMFAVMAVAEITGRSYDMLSALSFSCVILLMAKPYSLYDAGFVLSFGAVLGIGLIKPAADILFPVKKGRFGKLYDALSLSLCVNIFTFPVVLKFFYRIPVYSVFLNLILIPLMGILLVFAGLTGIIGLLSLKAAFCFSIICKVILGFYEGVCRLNDKLPFSVSVKGCPKAGEIIAYYLILLTVVFLAQKVKEGKIRIPLVYLRTGVCAVILAAFILIPVKTCPGIRITMLDIGQGDCGYIESKRGKTVLIDCGSSDEEFIARYKVIPFLHYMGKDRIDTAVVTHADSDHISGFIELFSMPEEESVPIGVLLMPDTAMKDEPYMELVELAKQRKVDIKFIHTGDSFVTDGIKFTCLHPDKGYACTERNEYSTVLSLSYGSTKALFTGDVEGRGEEAVTERIREHYTLLKCAHHGSKNSTPEEFVRRVKPLITFISAGRDNSFGHPSKEVTDRLKNNGSFVMVTKESGALSLESDGKKVTVSSYR